MTNFNGRTILVTGATGGIGGATVRHLVDAGADVIASGQSEEGLKTLVDDTGVRALPFDLASEDSVRVALDGLDVCGVVNCGGYGGEIATPMDTDIAVFDKVISINARGTLLCHQIHVSVDDPNRERRLDRQRLQPGQPRRPPWPRLLRLLEGCGRQHHTGFSIGGKYNIRVNSVNPTVVMTPMSAWYWGREDVEGPFLEAMPLGRWATEDEIAAPITFLLSDAASMITGVSLPIDGGYTCR